MERAEEANIFACRLFVLVHQWYSFILYISTLANVDEVGSVIVYDEVFGCFWFERHEMAIIAMHYKRQKHGGCDAVCVVTFALYLSSLIIYLSVAILFSLELQQREE